MHREGDLNWIIFRMEKELRSQHDRPERASESTHRREEVEGDLSADREGEFEIAELFPHGRYHSLSDLVLLGKKREKQRSMYGKHSLAFAISLRLGFRGTVGFSVRVCVPCLSFFLLA